MKSKIYFGILSLLLCSNSQATDLLVLSSNPGYVSHHYVYEDTCTLTLDGKLIFAATKSSSHSRETLKTFTKSVSPEELSKIRLALEEVRKLPANLIYHYQTAGGDLPDFLFMAYAPSSESEEDFVLDPRALVMHGNGDGLIRVSDPAQNLLLDMSERCEMERDILKKALQEYPSRPKPTAP